MHPYDIKADASSGDDELTIELRYGEGLKHESVRSFPRNAMEQLEPEVTLFFRETAEDCKKTAIADYYKLAKS